MKLFSKLDLSHAYLQVPLDEQSRQYVTINTHKGLFEYKRLTFGVASAPSIFQRLMENLFQGIQGVCVYIDDILITGSTDKEYLHNLALVLARLESAGMRLKREKCALLLPSVSYLGHFISAEGLKTEGAKVQAIVEAPEPRNVGELRSFLGMVTYYGKFLPDLIGYNSSSTVSLTREVYTLEMGRRPTEGIPARQATASLRQSAYAFCYPSFLPATPLPMGLGQCCLTGCLVGRRNLLDSRLAH